MSSWLACGLDVAWSVLHAISTTSYWLIWFADFIQLTINTSCQTHHNLWYFVSLLMQFLLFKLYSKRRNISIVVLGIVVVVDDNDHDDDDDSNTENTSVASNRIQNSTFLQYASSMIRDMIYFLKKSGFRIRCLWIGDGVGMWLIGNSTMG